MLFKKMKMFFVRFEIQISLSSVSSDTPQRARTRLDEILGRGTSPRLLERPVTGEKKETRASKNQTEEPPEKISSVKGDCINFKDRIIKEMNEF